MSDWEIVEDSGQGEWESVPQQQGFWSKLPKNIVAGLAGLAKHTGEGLIQGQKSIEDFGAGVQNIMGQMPGPKMPQAQPLLPTSEQNQQMLEEYLPQSKIQELGPENATLMDRIIQGGITYAPEIGGLAVGAVKASPYLFKKVAARPYKKAIKALEKENVTHMPSPMELIEDAKTYFKPSAANRALIQRAEEGDIQAIFKLQSDLGKISAPYTKNIFSAAERDYGRAGLKTKGEILDAQQEFFKGRNLEEIAKLFEKGRKQYRGYHKFKPYKYGAIGLAATQTPIPSYIAKLMLHRE